MYLSLLGRRRPSQAQKSGPPSTKHATHSTLQTKGSSGSHTNATIDSLTKMRDTIKDLEKREKFLSVKAKTQHEEALAKTKAGDKQGAVAAITRKKMFEKEVLKLIQMKANLEAQILSIESASVSLVAHEGMQAGLNAQRLVSQNLDPDAIAELHQDIEDHLNQADEASNILSSVYNTADVFDEDQLLAELQDELAQENGQKAAKPTVPATEDDEVERLAQMMSSIPAVPQSSTLPTAPQTPVTMMDDDEEELRKLEREMGL